jgi:hypothetical protein
VIRSGCCLETFYDPEADCPDTTNATWSEIVHDDFNYLGQLAWHNSTSNSTTVRGMATWGDYYYREASKNGLFREMLDLEWASALNNVSASYYNLIGDYMGVGWNLPCRSYIDNAMEGKDEYDGAGWQAANVLMALTPVLLTFGNLFVPRSSEVFCTSFLVGLTSAALGLGLPVKSISGVPPEHQVKIARFGLRMQRQISQMGTSVKQKRRDLCETAAFKYKLDDMQKFSAEPPTAAKLTTINDGELDHTDHAFLSVKQVCQAWHHRTHCWRLPALLVSLSQLGLLIFLVCPLFMGTGTPSSLFDW